MFTIHEVLQIPTHHGPIAGMANFQDRVLVVTVDGTLYELRKDWLTDEYDATPHQPKHKEPA